MKLNLFLNDRLTDDDSSRTTPVNYPEVTERHTELRQWRDQAHGGEPESLLFSVTDSGRVHFHHGALPLRSEGDSADFPFSGEMLYTSLLHGAAGIGFESYRERFEKLKEEWIENTFFMSSVSDMMTHETYQRIIGMGLPAVPLLLEDLSEDPQHWFWALEAITGIDPIPEDEKGDVRAMSERWVEWGKRTGLFPSKERSIFHKLQHVGSRTRLPQPHGEELSEDE